MALLNQAIHEKKLDVRVIEKNLVRGLTSAQEYEKSLKELPDDSANAEWRNVDQIDELFRQPRSRA